jgi:hypothetical protein
LKPAELRKRQLQEDAAAATDGVAIMATVRHGRGRFAQAGSNLPIWDQNKLEDGKWLTRTTDMA